MSTGVSFLYLNIQSFELEGHFPLFMLSEVWTV